MNKNLTELVIISDRSGSMHLSAQEAAGAINSLVQDQTKKEGELKVTLAEFNHKYNLVTDAVDGKEFPEYKLLPSGFTALYDAVGYTIANVGNRLANTPEDQKPGLVSVVISTDGYENSSKEYTLERIKDMIKEQKDKYSWSFTFLGVDLEETVGTSMGIDEQNVVKISRNNTGKSMNMYNSKFGAVRGMVSAGNNVKEEIFETMGYTTEEKTELEG